MQKILRILIIIAMLITCYLLILAWRDDYATTKPTATKPVATKTNDVPVVVAGGDVPVLNTTQTASAPVQAGQFISVSTDRYDIKIDPVGGDVVSASLKQYNAVLGGDEPFVLLESGQGERTYVAQSGRLGQDGIDTSMGRATYISPQAHYVLNETSGTLQVPLIYKKDGLTITKTYTFKAGEYPITVSYNINNATESNWQGQMYAQLKRDNSTDPGLDDKGMMGMATYLGGVC